MVTHYLIYTMGACCKIELPGSFAGICFHL